MLLECLDSIHDTTPKECFEIIIVDSGSTDGTIEMIKTEYPDIKLIQNQKFYGFSSGNNQAFQLATGKHIMILNDDTLVLPDTISELLEYVKGNPKVGAIGPRLLNKDLSHQYSSYLSFPTIKTDLLTNVLQIKWLRDLFNSGRSCDADKLDHYGIRNGKKDEVRQVKHLMGACILIRKEVLQTVGALDEHFYLSLEDQDWCKRIGEAGWEVIFYPASKIIHLGNQTVKNLANFGKIYFRSRSYFQKKHYGLLSLFLFKIFTVFIACNNFLISFLLYLCLFYSSRRMGYRSVMSHSVNTIYWVLGGKKEYVRDLFKTT
jgi:Predicted glycosyltransferases